MRYKTVPWRSGYAEVCKTSYAGSIPAGTSTNCGKMGEWGFVAQLVEQRPEEPCVAGSSPAEATTQAFEEETDGFLLNGLSAKPSFLSENRRFSR